MKSSKEFLKNLPSVDEILRWPEFLSSTLGHTYKVWLIRQVLSDFRTESRDPESLRNHLSGVLQEHACLGLRACINATGVLLHTNLGRAPLALRAVKRLQEVAGNYCNLELDLTQGERGGRLDYIRNLLRSYVGCPEVLVVNNNAAALFLAIRTFVNRGRGKEVVISRGELVEIGGSFRIPEMIEEAGAKLVEVGTTNRTYLDDYERAATVHSALFLKVHPSNFFQQGFCHEVSRADLVGLGKKLQIPVLEDFGSGCIVNRLDCGPQKRGRESSVGKVWSDGVDCVTFSGDKLLGGPQCGIILGKGGNLNAMARDPLYRTLRLSKLDLAALEATMELYGSNSQDEIPVLAMLGAKESDLKRRAQSLAYSLQGLGLTAKTEKGFSQVGGGALPASGLPTWLVRIATQKDSCSVETLAKKLRFSTPPVLVRIGQNQIICDMRTVFSSQVEVLADCILNLALRKERQND